jgi:hypothetical protein
VDTGQTRLVEISQGTVTGGLKRLGPLFEPLYEMLIARNVSESLWHADETRRLVFEEMEGKQGYKWYLWVFRSESTVVYVLDPSRAAEVPEGHFGKEAAGILVVDRYSAYKAMVAGRRRTSPSFFRGIYLKTNSNDTEIRPSGLRRTTPHCRQRQISYPALGPIAQLGLQALGHDDPHPGRRLAKPIWVSSGDGRDLRGNPSLLRNLLQSRELDSPR